MKGTKDKFRKRESTYVNEISAHLERLHERSVQDLGIVDGDAVSRVTEAEAEEGFVDSERSNGSLGGEVDRPSKPHAVKPH